MANCRTESSPVMVVECSDCGNKEVIPHSCGHRSCPHCQHYESQRWLERQRAKLLPVSYFMVTFTLPRQLLEVAAASSTSMSYIGELRPRVSLSSKTEDFFDSKLLPVRKALIFGASRTAIRNPSVTRVRVTPPRPQTVKTYFL